MRVLLLTGKYNAPEDGPYLTNDLAHALRRLGHEVRVVALEWELENNSVQRWDEDGIKVLRVSTLAPRAAGTLLHRFEKWGLSSRRALPAVRAELSDWHPEILIAFAPTVIYWSVLRWIMRRDKPLSYAFNADFFPYYHRSIGLVPPGIVFSAAKALEQITMRWFDVIGCMSPGNVRFLRQHFRLKPDQRTHVLHLWGEVSRPETRPAAEVRQEFGLPLDRTIGVFGGQLIPGRGIDDILETARLARTERPDLFFLFVGRGPLSGKIARAIEDGASNVALFSPLPRDKYMDVAAACDVGINATAAHVIVPTFPTKTIDYARAKLPILASVEAPSDYGDFVEENQLGLAVPAGEPQRLLAAFARLADDQVLRSTAVAAGLTALDRYFDVNKAAASIIAVTTASDASGTE